MKDNELIELAERNKDISIEEIQQDIRDTQEEITEYRWRKWNYKWRFDETYIKEIEEREVFIEKLENIIKWKLLINS